MNIINDNFNIDSNSLSLSFLGKGFNNNSNISNDYNKFGIGFQLLSNNTDYKEFAIVDTSNFNRNYYASLRVSIEKSKIALKSITSNNIIQPLVINDNIYIGNNIGIGKSITNPIYDIDTLSNINTDNYFLKGTNISNIFTTSNLLQTSLLNVSNANNTWIKSTSTMIYTNSNVGINKNNPQYNLDVAGNINFTGNLTQNGVRFNNFNGNYWSLDNRPNITWELYGNNIVNLNSGNVGINSSLPTAKLDINGDINFTGRLLYNRETFGGDWNTMINKPIFADIAYTGNPDDLSTPISSGTLTGIEIYWNNIKNLPNFAAVAYNGSYNSLTDKPNLFQGSYTELRDTPLIPFLPIPGNTANMNSVASGNIGIKQSSPSYTLDVNGDINFTGNLRKNGVSFNSVWGGDYVTRSELKPIAFNGDFNSITPKPTLFDTSWEKIANIPALFDFQYTSLKNSPIYMKTKWELIEDIPPNRFDVYWSAIKDKPAFASVAYTGKLESIDNITNLKSVAYSGNYNDLENKPVLFSGHFWDLKFIPRIFSGNYNDLDNLPAETFLNNKTTGNMTSVNTNNIGIGKNPPSYKLDVNGDINISTGFFYKQNGNNLVNSTATFSDNRIKTNIVDINDISALEKILKLEPKNYNYIDTDERGSGNVIGFIAQQVEEIVPEAVTIGEEFIPNIYKYYQILSTNTILVDDANINKISIGNIIKIKINGLTYIAKVIDKTNKTIKIDINLDVNSKCMIYGVKINDFHFIDKNYLYTLNICATQELYRRLEEQKKEIEELKLIISKIVS
jgi:hypothetical protein